MHALAGSALAEPLRRRAWLTQFDATTIERGKRYAQQGRVSLVGIDGDTLLTPGHGVRFTFPTAGCGRDARQDVARPDRTADRRRRC